MVFRGAELAVGREDVDSRSVSDSHRRDACATFFGGVIRAGERGVAVLNG